jgi:hypothetical protein
MSTYTIRFGIRLHIMLDKSYSNSYEHGIVYISLDGRNSPLFGS